MRRAALTTLALAIMLAPLGASSGNGFGTLERRLEAALHAKPLHPHLLGFAALMGRMFDRRQAAGLHLAIFPAPGAVDVRQLAAGALPADWMRMVYSRDNNDGEQALIYVRQRSRNSFQMLILAFDPQGSDNDSGGKDGDGPQVVLMSLNVNPAQLMQQAEQRRR